MTVLRWKTYGTYLCEELLSTVPILITICVQDGHPTGQRPFHDFQRLWGWKYEQAGIRLLLEWMDKEGFSHPNCHHCRLSEMCICVVDWYEDHDIGYWQLSICVIEKYWNFQPDFGVVLKFSDIICFYYKADDRSPDNLSI